jgi:hypothetical protein
MTSHPVSLRSVLIFSRLCLGLPSGIFPSGFPNKTLYAPFLSSVCALFTWSSLHSFGTLPLLEPSIFLSPLFLIPLAVFLPHSVAKHF